MGERASVAIKRLLSLPPPSPYHVTRPAAAVPPLLAYAATKRGLAQLSAPQLPEQCLKEPSDCCGGGCDPCVWQSYSDYLKDYQAALTKWEERGLCLDEVKTKLQARTADDFIAGDRATIRNVRTQSLRYLNGTLVDVLGPDGTTEISRWEVRPVGGRRILRLPPKMLELQRPSMN